MSKLGLAKARDCGHPRLVGEPIDDDQARSVSHTLRALADPVRLRILSLIGSAHDGEVRVNDLAAAFHLALPTISHHLKILREAGLVSNERRQSWVYYRFSAGSLDQLTHLFTDSSPR